MWSVSLWNAFHLSSFHRVTLPYNPLPTCLYTRVCWVEGSYFYKNRLRKDKTVTNLQLYVSLLAYRNFAPHICIILVTQEKRISADHDLSKPFQNVCVVHDLMLNKFLGDREQDLGTDVPECVDRCLRIPGLDFVRMMKYQQSLHGLLRDIWHGRLVDQTDQTVDQLKSRALNFVTRFALVLKQTTAFKWCRNFLF